MHILVNIGDIDIHSRAALTRERRYFGLLAYVSPRHDADAGTVRALTDTLAEPIPIDRHVRALSRDGEKIARSRFITQARWRELDDWQRLGNSVACFPVD